MRKIIVCGAVAVLAMTAGSAGARTNSNDQTNQNRQVNQNNQATQNNRTKTIPGQEVSVTGTIEAIERSSREVTVKLEDGRYEVFYVPQDIKRFDSLKVGQTITARRSDSVVLNMKPAGESPVDTETETITRQRTPTGTTGTEAHERTVTATITAIDPNVPSITFTGPQYWTYTSRVRDRDALSNVKVGDRMDITWKEGVAVSVEPSGARTTPSTSAQATEPKAAPSPTSLTSAITAGAPKTTVLEPERWNITAFLGPGSGGGLQGNAMQLGVAGGYGFNDRVAFEGEFAYAHQSNSSLIDVSSNSQVYTANVLYHIPYKGWLPYAAFGIGAIHGNADLNVPTATVNGAPFSQSESATEFAFDLGAGVKKALGGGVRFRGDFRIFDSGGNLPTLWRFYGGLTFLLAPR